MTDIGNLLGDQPENWFPTRKSGQIFRGNAPPSDVSDQVEGAYVDASSDHKLYIKRKPPGGVAAWGNWIYELPIAIATTTKWYGDTRPDDGLGVAGDHYLLWGCVNPTVEPHVFGPKGDGAWPENGEGVEICPGGSYGTETTATGVLSEAGSADTLDGTFGSVGLLSEIPELNQTFDCFTPVGVLLWGVPLSDFGAVLNPDWNVDPALTPTILGVGLLSEEA